MGYDADKIRSLNPLTEQLDKYGVAVNKKGFAACPFHSEKTASFKIYPDGTFHCFGCGAHGDVISFVMKMQGIPFPEACKQLDGDIKYSEQRRIVRAKRTRNTAESRRERAVADYWRVFDEWKDNEDVIALFKPSSPDEIPNALFLMALDRRSGFENRLDAVETKYVNGGE